MRSEPAAAIGAMAHNSAGGVPSWVKLLLHFYGWQDEDAAMDGRPLGELVLLRRLGVSEERLRAFVERIDHVESLT